jgi:hypothetical protein
LLHELLIAVSEGAGSPHYPEIREVARRHRVNLGDVTDRAALFLTVVRERQRMDLYRTLGVPPLAAAETLQRRWRAIVKETHPDKGGDVARFHHARRAYEVLRDPARRVEYERFWQRAIAPFQDFAGADPAALDVVPPSISVVPGDMPVPQSATSAGAGGLPAPHGHETWGDSGGPALGDARRVLAAWAARPARDFEDRVTALCDFVSRLESALAVVSLQDIDRLRDDLARASAFLAPLCGELTELATTKRRLDP